VDNPHAAFCTKGCWLQYHRSRCVVCEGEFKRKPKADHQLCCGRRKCASEFRSWPRVYNPFGVGTGRDVKSARSRGRSARKTAFELPHSLRRWSWLRMPGEDEDYELLNAAGKMVARIRQEGEQWWVARPRCCTPEPPLETLDEARKRAVSLVLMAMPSPLADPNKRIVKDVLRERALYPWRFNTAGERCARARLCKPLPVVPAPGIVPANVPDVDDPLAIPDFLIRPREAVPA
jgi:hypothetical protein